MKYPVRFPTLMHQSPYHAAGLRPNRQPAETLEAGLERIHRVARTRYGMVAGAIIVALAQMSPHVHTESFAAFVRDLLPAVVIAVTAIPIVAGLARRDERRLRALNKKRRF